MAGGKAKHTHLVRIVTGHFSWDISFGNELKEEDESLSLSKKQLNQKYNWRGTECLKNVLGTTSSYSEVTTSLTYKEPAEQQGN